MEICSLSGTLHPQFLVQVTVRLLRPGDPCFHCSLQLPILANTRTSGEHKDTYLMGLSPAEDVTVFPNYPILGPIGGYGLGRGTHVGTLSSKQAKPTQDYR